jgi:hypothetical protein
MKRILFALLFTFLLTFPVKAQDVRISYGDKSIDGEADHIVTPYAILDWPEATIGGATHEDVRYDLFAVGVNDDRSNPVVRVTTETNSARAIMDVHDIGGPYVAGLRAWQMVDGVRKESRIYWSDEEDSPVYKWAPYTSVRFNHFKPTLRVEE